MNFDPCSTHRVGRGCFDFIQECLWLILRSPLFYFASGHLSVCDGRYPFGPLNLSLDASVCALVGRNGSGKTRLLRLLAGLMNPPAVILSALVHTSTWRSSRIFLRIPRLPNCLVTTRSLRARASTAVIMNPTISTRSTVTGIWLNG